MISKKSINKIASRFGVEVPGKEIYSEVYFVEQHEGQPLLHGISLLLYKWYQLLGYL
jgi:hypothetical protein